jgi:hypothetical protein
MEEYYCKCCKFHTNRIYNFKEHVNTQKHSNNSEIICNENTNYKQFKKKIYCCNTCDNVYMLNRSLINHKKTCAGNTEIEMLKQKVQKLEQVIETKDVLLMTKETQLSNVIDVAKDNSKMASTSMNMLKYAKMYLNDVEPLEQLEDDDVYKVMNYKNPKNTEIKNEDYVKIVIHKFNHNIFANFIGDMIIEHYKPKETNKTNVIATDTSRLCFIIMQNIKKKGKTEKKEWINDKSGERFTKLILTPLLTIIKKTLDEFVAFKKNKEFSENLLCLMAKCVELKRDIEIEKFTKPILRHVAPSFHFDKLKFMDDDDDKLSEDETQRKIIIKKKN